MQCASFSPWLRQLWAPLQRLIGKRFPGDIPRLDLLFEHVCSFLSSNESPHPAISTAAFSGHTAATSPGPTMAPSMPSSTNYPGASHWLRPPRRSQCSFCPQRRPSLPLVFGPPFCHWDWSQLRRLPFPASFGQERAAFPQWHRCAACPCVRLLVLFLAPRFHLTPNK